ncbi:VWA domain-containing protein [Halococcus saccharolyticus]|uniref:Protporphyrin IX magnesium chelatase n=1 Tax=Halococcus saccharolyticus DSM 5350 TaxID=1227455 RepID=M0MGM6_9EURY|nr:VWA domain-containing protein [Halococcus saccharolyticus]EMA44866.1 protporphyrin IX magnesium chelatase [Halococcus saccharolyticus DSM 5350]
MFDYAAGKNSSPVGRAGSDSQRIDSGLSFGEIVGQDGFKQALLAVAANDALDGLLIRGEKGTAKSTAVRALTDLLPAQTVIADCPYGCPPDDPAAQCDDCRAREEPPATERPVPLVTLPLGATRERIVGTLSVVEALDGEHAFDPGLLARANRGILYVDEINLLDDHLVDVLLDAAAGGVNRVERDGMSHSHPADFTLVGTMNPEEGDLRPQLRDRFALQTTVTACEDLDQRVAIIQQALDGDAGEGRQAENGRPDPETSAARERLLRAREGLDAVELSREQTTEIAALCRDAGVDGHRGDVATARAARTFAALDGRSTVAETDVRRAAELALAHRLQSQPFEDAPDIEDVLDDHFDRDEPSSGEQDANGDDGKRERTGGGSDDERADDGNASGGDADDATPDDRGGSGGDTDTDDTERTEESDERETPPTNDGETGSDGPAESGSDSGAAVDGGNGAARMDDGDSEAGEADEDGGHDPDAADDADDVPLVPGQERADVGTARAPEVAAPEIDTDVSDGAGTGSRAEARSAVDSQGSKIRSRRAESGDGIDAAASVRAAANRGASGIESRDLRQSVRAGSASTLVVFAVDASASMRPAMRAAKGTVMELLKGSYQERDAVALVAFAGDEADVLLPPTDSVGLAARHLKELPTGDRTPLPDGLRSAAGVIARADPAASVTVLVTDGRANVAEGSPVAATREAAGRLASLGSNVLVVDAGDGGRAGVAKLVVEATTGERVPLSALSADRVDAAVTTARDQDG